MLEVRTIVVTLAQIAEFLCSQSETEIVSLGIEDHGRQRMI
jgi:hypothetical protein